MAKQFKYKALNKITNKTVVGFMEAPTEIAVDKILSDNNLMLISCSENKPSVLNILNQRITTKDLITLFITLEQLEKAGVPLIESIGDMKNYTTSQILKDVVQDLYESLKNGLLLSEAMAKHPKVFDEVSVSLVVMGEKTGALANSFLNIIDNLKWSAEIKRKITKAIKGPLSTLVLMLIIALIMLKFVVPTVLSFVTGQDLEMPRATLALIATSDFIGRNFAYIISIPIIIFIIIKLLCKNYKCATAIDTLKIKMPILGTVIQKIELSRFAKFFGLTFNAGIPVLECIDITIQVVQNKRIKEEIKDIKQKLVSGMCISRTLQQSPYFSPIVVRMFKIGEDTGDMLNALINVNYFYETEINDSIDMVIESLKPMILFLMGGLLSWIIVGVFGPIYGNFANIL